MLVIVEREVLHLTVISMGCQLDDRVQGDAPVGNLVEGEFEEISQQAAEHSLVGNNNDWRLDAFQLKDDWLQAFNDVNVAFTLWVSVVKLISRSSSKLLRVLFLDLFVSETIAHSTLNLIQSLPMDHFGGTRYCSCSHDGPLQTAAPHRNLLRRSGHYFRLFGNPLSEPRCILHTQLCDGGIST